METDEIKIEVYNKREKTTSTMFVKQLSDNTFRMTENDILNCRLTYGTEFETRINSDGKHEIIRIIKDSGFLTRRFFLPSKYKEPDYRILGDEIIRHGGFWQVDFGGIATINLPKDCELDLDEIFKFFDFKPTEIVNDI